MILGQIVAALYFGFLVTYPIKRFVRYCLCKLSMPVKSLIIVTFVVCSLVTLVLTLLIYGFTLQFVDFYIGSIIGLLYWAWIDVLSTRKQSKFIDFLRNKYFRIVFGAILAFSIFSITMELFNYYIDDPYYISPLLFTLLYMSAVYRKPNFTKTKKQINDESLNVD